MATCLYCLNEATSREHWIPRGLGAFRGFTPLLDRLCDSCNNRLGREIDQELMRTGPTGFGRTLLGVEGREGPPRVGAFHYKTMQPEQPTTMMMPALGRDHELFAEAYTDENGNVSSQPIRQVVLKMPDGRVGPVPFSRGWSADQLRTAVKNRGLEGGIPIEMYVDDDENGNAPDDPEMIKVRRLLGEVFGQFSAEVYGGPGERTVNRLMLVMGINLLYLRAIAKAAFHYFLWTCPTLRGDEPTFAPIRAFIATGVGDWRDFVTIDGPQFLPPLKQGYRPVRTSHFFYAALSREEAIGIVQFFVGPYALPPPSRVKLAANPLTIEGKDFSCHQACYFEDKQDGHDGELITIEVWERRIITS